MTFYIILAFSAFFISLIGTKLIILTLRNRPTSPDIQLLTKKRKMPPLENGGIAVVFAIIIGFLGTEEKTMYSVIPSIFILTGLPMLSNIVPFPKTLKLIILIVAIIIPLSFFSPPIFNNYLPPLLDKILAGCFWLWVIHSFKKLDIVEGLLPIEMISIGAGLIAVEIIAENFFSPLTIQSLIFAMAGFGFFWWNRHPAKILAGEIASIPVGFVAGYLLLLAASSGYAMVALILPAYFLADSFLIFFNKLFFKKDTSGQKSKYSQPYCLQAIKNSNSTEWIVRVITGVNMLLILLATRTLLYPEMSLFNLFIAYVMVFTLIWIFTRVKNKTIP